MSCTNTEKWLLLAQSGELSRFNRRRLARHLEACPACRELENELRIVTTLAHNAPADLAVSEAVLASIRSEGLRAASRSEEIRLRPAPRGVSLIFRPAVAYAVLAIALAAGLWFFATSDRHQAPTVAQADTEWDDDFDQRIEELDNTLVIASSDWTDSETTSNGTESDDPETMAKELLALEGQQI